MTVKNEAASLPRLFETLAAQTQKPDEVIITDGGSTDDTIRLLQATAPAFHFQVLEAPGSNISQGRNTAIAQTSAEIIVSMDAGVRLDAQWFANITRPFFADRAPDVVSGFFVPDPIGAFETALAATTLPEQREIHPETFLPSSRSVAFRRAVWEQVQGYPEWLDYCEDLVFDFALRNAGCHFEFHPEARVFFRPRHALGKFFRQYFLYARGDGKAGLWFKRHLVRYATYLGAIPLSLALFPFAPALSVVMWLLGCYALFGRPYRRLFNLWEPLSTLDKLSALMWVPVIRISGDMAKMLGYPFGILWRIRHGRMT